MERAADRIRFAIAPGGMLRGATGVPGDKSISHRALIFGAIADGLTRVEGFLDAQDTLATLDAMRALGVGVERSGTTLRIQGVGREGLRRPDSPLNFGNSGTGMRLAAGLLAGQRFSSRLVGDASLSRRPMGRIRDPLLRMGARIRTGEQGTPPLEVGGDGSELRGIDYEMPVASAQVKSCLLIAALYARGTTRVREPAPSRDHTERMLESFGYPVERKGRSVALEGGGLLRARSIRVPGDLSSAAFLMVGALIARGSLLLLAGVGVNPTRAGVIDILRDMGADIEMRASAEECAGEEPVADFEVRSRELRGVDITPERVPLAIDEIPALCIAAACARGVTRVRGAAELRVKESDRLETMAEGLRALGIRVRTLADGMDIHGGEISGGRVDSQGDHRIAMAFAMAGLRARGPVAVDDCRNVGTSFPGFAESTAALGLRILQQRA